MELRDLANKFVQPGVHASIGKVYGGGKQVFQLDFSRLDTRYNYLLFLSQAGTETILRERLEQYGVQIERGIELISFQQDESSVTAVLREKDGRDQQFRASYLVAADGAHSVVRTMLGLNFEGKTFDQSYVLGDFYVDSELSDTDSISFPRNTDFWRCFR